MTTGDLLLKLMDVTGQIYEPLIQLIGPRLPPSVLDSPLYRHPHTLQAARSLVSTGQFSPCEHCRQTSCPVNVMYGRFFACVYFFVTNLHALTGEKFGVGCVSKMGYIRLLLGEIVVDKTSNGQ